MDRSHLSSLPSCVVCDGSRVAERGVHTARRSTTWRIEQRPPPSVRLRNGTVVSRARCSRRASPRTVSPTPPRAGPAPGARRCRGRRDVGQRAGGAAGSRWYGIATPSAMVGAAWHGPFSCPSRIRQRAREGRRQRLGEACCVPALTPGQAASARSQPDSSRPEWPYSVARAMCPWRRAERGRGRRAPTQAGCWRRCGRVELFNPLLDRRADSGSATDERAGRRGAWMR